MSKLQYWKELPPNPDYERVGRIVKNAFGEDETVVMERRFWKHFDWLEQQGNDMAVWVKNADFDRHKPEYQNSLRREIMRSLKVDEERRYLSNMTCPMFIEPDGYNAPRQKFELPERLATDNEWFDRPLKNMFGLEVTVSMPGKYWRMYDWLIQIGADVDRFLCEADMLARKKNISLGEALMNGFHLSEKVNYLKGKNHPLFLSGSGYSDRDFRDGGRRMDERIEANDVKRKFEDTDGSIIEFGMPRPFWQYFDWLNRNGQDMLKWVRDANITRFKKDGCVFPMRTEMMYGLHKDEFKRFCSDEPSPLFINPDGYEL